MTFAINYSILELSIPFGAERAIQLWCSIVKQKRQRTRKSELARKKGWKCGFLCCQSDKKLLLFLCRVCGAAPELTFRQNEKRANCKRFVNFRRLHFAFPLGKSFGKLFLSLERLIISSWRQIWFIYAAALFSSRSSFHIKHSKKKVFMVINEPKRRIIEVFAWIHNRLGSLKLAVKTEFAVLKFCINFHTFMQGFRFV